MTPITLMSSRRGHVVWRRGLAALLPVLAAALAGACSSTNPDNGGAAGAVKAGTACAADGSTAPSEDGCNTCTCTNRLWACTQRACLDAGTTPCQDGDTTPAPDGCNTCSCHAGQWMCTMMGCVQCPAPAQTGQACVQVVVYAKSPTTGDCCEYATPCAAPSGWQQFYSMQECVGGTTTGTWYTTCGYPVCGGPGTDGGTGATPCTAAQQQGTACNPLGTLCDPGLGCGVNLVCATSDPKLGMGGCPISRARFKTDIHYLSEAERTAYAQHLLELPLATWRYREARDRREHLGFIIEDVEPSPSVDGARDQVDLYGYASMAVAALQEQAKELRALRAEVESLRARVQPAGEASCSRP